MALTASCHRRRQMPMDHPQSAKVPLAALREFVIKNDPGGICSLIPRRILYARVWCDQLIDGDNCATLNAQVRAKLRR